MAKLVDALDLGSSASRRESSSLSACTIEKLDELEIVRFLMSFKQCGRKVVEKWSNALIIFFVLYIILLGDKNV